MGELISASIDSSSSMFFDSDKAMAHIQKMNYGIPMLRNFGEMVQDGALERCIAALKMAEALYPLEKVEEIKKPSYDRSFIGGMGGLGVRMIPGCAIFGGVALAFSAYIAYVQKCDYETASKNQKYALESNKDSRKKRHEFMEGFKKEVSLFLSILESRMREEQKQADFRRKEEAKQTDHCRCVVNMLILLIFYLAYINYNKYKIDNETISFSP